MIQVKRLSHATFETPDLERQIDYFTQVVGLQVAGRENGTAFLATKVGDIAVRVREGQRGALRPHRLSGRPGDRASPTSARGWRPKASSRRRATTQRLACREC